MELRLEPRFLFPARRTWGSESSLREQEAGNGFGMFEVQAEGPLGGASLEQLPLLPTHPRAERGQLKLPRALWVLMLKPEKAPFLEGDRLGCFSLYVHYHLARHPLGNSPNQYSSCGSAR